MPSFLSNVSLVFALFLITGCSTLDFSKDFDFETINEVGLIAVPNPPAFTNGKLHTLEFFRLDYENRKLGERFTGCSSCTSSEGFYLLQNVASDYILVPLKPGIYTLTEFWTQPLQHIRHKLCSDAPAFEVEAGKVSFLNPLSFDSADLPKFRNTFEKISGKNIPVVGAKGLSRIQFDCGISMGRLFYKPGAPFTIK